MKIRVKHNNTEIEITDSGTDNTNSLIYYNVSNTIKIIANIADDIIRMEREGVTGISQPQYEHCVCMENKPFMSEEEWVKEYTGEKSRDIG